MYRFFFHAPSPSEIYTLSLHDALPISQYFVDIVINRFGKAFIDEQLMTAGNYYGDDDDDDWGNDDNNNNNNNNSGYGNYGRAMSAPAFDQFKQSLQNESFDQSRLSMAKQ